jgi:hypothetical protein
VSRYIYIEEPGRARFELASSALRFTPRRDLRGRSPRSSGSSFLAILAGMTLHMALTAKTKAPIILVALAFLAGSVSALPVSRPWEYFNETMVPARDAWLYFDDEDIDMSQRGKELASYYHQLIQPTGEVPYITYNLGLSERKARSLEWLDDLRNLFGHHYYQRQGDCQKNVVGSSRLTSGPAGGALRQHVGLSRNV